MWANIWVEADPANLIAGIILGLCIAHVCMKWNIRPFATSSSPSLPRTPLQPPPVVPPRQPVPLSTPSHRTRPSQLMGEVTAAPLAAQFGARVAETRPRALSTYEVHRYTGVVDSLIEQLLESYRGTAADGWLPVGKPKKGGVVRWKKAVTGSFVPCVKGELQITTSWRYVLDIVADFTQRKLFDSSFKQGHIVEKLDKFSQVQYLEYDRQWPFTARDYCLVQVIRRNVDGNGGIMVGWCSVDHESCPEYSGRVRAEVIGAGFIIAPAPDLPNECTVTHISLINLKGSLPKKLLNRQALEQPNTLKDVCKHAIRAVALDKGGSTGGIGGSSEVKTRDRATSNAPNNATPTHHGSNTNNIISSTLLTPPPAAAVGLVRSISGGGSTRDLSASPSPSPASAASSSSKETKNNNISSTDLDYDISGRETPDRGPDSDDDDIEIPVPIPTRLTDHDRARYHTQGELVVASMLQDISNVDQWVKVATENQVKIYRKIIAGSAIHCFKGKGIVKCSPDKVFAAIRQPEFRRRYDSLLKDVRVMAEVDDQTSVVWMRLETRQCLVKAARDVCLLQHCATIGDRLVYAAQSIDYASCPPSKSTIRSMVTNSGWIVEPYVDKDPNPPPKYIKSWSKVTYVTQINLGGSVPTSVINMVAKRQPLCVHAIRKYLET